MTDDRSPFHRGEKEIQSRFGKAEKMAQIGRRVIRDYMPDEHQEFFSLLPHLLVGSVDLAGRPWASVLAGPPGFVRALGRARARGEGAARHRRPRPGSLRRRAGAARKDR